MTVMVLEIYDALRSAGAEEEKARRAAEAMARDDRFDRLEALIEKLSVKVDDSFTKVDDRQTSLEALVTRVEARFERQGKMLGFVFGIMTAVASGMILLLFRVFLGGVT